MGAVPYAAMPIAVEDAPAPLARAPRAWLPWAVAAMAATLLVGWYVWPATRGDDVDVVVVGDGAVVEARDEIERRFRQEGMIVHVVERDPCEPGLDLRALRGDAELVVSSSAGRPCTIVGGGGLVVEQPLGSSVQGSGDGWRHRSAAPLFPGGDVVRCEWWDTPGAGEARPGLGQCVGGGVQVLEDGHLTDAGKERFARLMVEAAK